MLPILYSFRRCPYAIRARMALKIAGIDYGLRNILLRDKPAEMLQASAKGTVPVLVLPNNSVIDESLDVMLWALKQHDPLSLLEDMDKSLELIKENDTGFKQALDKYKYPNRYAEDEIDWQMEASKFVYKLEKLLSEDTYLFASEPKLADFAIFPFIRQFKMPDEQYFIDNFPKTSNWLDKMTQTDIFKQVMPKTQVYNHSDLKA
ncbi:MAG TPA: glutathione S-transferase [Alphaproteobacteria bacterium]|mgnify:CR=1 FL=1|nr:glutathione S-transferase [Alphaproteobacteria bacterium]